ERLARRENQPPALALLLRFTSLLNRGGCDFRHVETMAARCSRFEQAACKATLVSHLRAREIALSKADDPRARDFRPPLLTSEQTQTFQEVCATQLAFEHA